MAKQDRYWKYFNKDYSMDLLEFIDWAINLSEKEEVLFRHELKRMREVKKMPYVMSFVRIAKKEKGREKRRITERLVANT
jgi:hypothetical protein